MKEKGIAVTYDEYRKGAGLGRLSCYKGLDYLIKLLEQDNYYSEELEDTVVFIESHINHIEKENKKYKEVINRAVKFIEDNYYSLNTTDINSIAITSNKLLQVRNILKEVG